ncbi:MAG: hypothetical protein GY940_09565, partial [bacterium]|nr:hypothetical protein [bacterium]
MIEIKNLIVRKDKIILNGIDLQVNNGEVYLLLFRGEQGASAFTDIMTGYQPIEEGGILLDSQEIVDRTDRRVTIINRIENPGD